MDWCFFMPPSPYKYITTSLTLCATTYVHACWLYKRANLGAGTNTASPAHQLGTSTRGGGDNLAQLTSSHVRFFFFRRELPIVFDLGSSKLKIGFCGDSSPRCYCPPVRGEKKSTSVTIGMGSNGKISYGDTCIWEAQNAGVDFEISNVIERGD